MVSQAQRVGAPSVGVAEATLAAADKAAETAARRAELSSRLAFLSKPGVAASEVDRTALKAAIDEARAVGGVSVAFAESRLGQAMLLIKRDSSIKRLAELVAASSDPLTVDREALRAAVEEANAVGADASEAEAKLLAAEQAAAPQFRVFDRCAVAQNDVAQQLSRAYVLSYDEATLSYTCALGRPDAPETRVVHASAMRPFDPEEHYAPPGQEFPMGSQVRVATRAPRTHSTPCTRRTRRTPSLATCLLAAHPSTLTPLACSPLFGRCSSSARAGRSSWRLSSSTWCLPK